MDRDSMNDTASAPQTRELTAAELDAVSGGSFQWGVGMMSSGGDRPSESLTISSYQSGGGGATAVIAII
jgi:hypothetical protein